MAVGEPPVPHAGPGAGHDDGVLADLSGLPMEDRRPALTVESRWLISHNIVGRRLRSIRSCGLMSAVAAVVAFVAVVPIWCSRPSCVRLALSYRTTSSRESPNLLGSDVTSSTEDAVLLRGVLDAVQIVVHHRDVDLIADFCR